MDSRSGGEGLLGGFSPSLLVVGGSIARGNHVQDIRYHAEKPRRNALVRRLGIEAEQGFDEERNESVGARASCFVVASSGSCQATIWLNQQALDDAADVSREGLGHGAERMC
jgi:hypothetical protein